MTKHSKSKRSVKSDDGVWAYDALDHMTSVLILFPIPGTDDEAIPLHIATAWLRRFTGKPLSIYFMELVGHGNYRAHENRPETGVFYACMEDYPTNHIGCLYRAHAIFAAMAGVDHVEGSA